MGPVFCCISLSRLMQSCSGSVYYDFGFQPFQMCRAFSKPTSTKAFSQTYTTARVRACVCVCRLGLGWEVSAHFARELGPGFPQAVELHGTSKMVELGPKSATAYFFPNSSSSYLTLIPSLDLPAHRKESGAGFSVLYSVNKLYPCLVFRILAGCILS